MHKEKTGEKRVIGVGWGRLLSLVGGDQDAWWMWHLRRYWMKWTGSMMMTPHFLPPELISLGIHSHTQPASWSLPLDVSGHVTLNRSSPTSSIPHPQHILILPHLSHLSHWHHLHRCSSQNTCEPTYSSSSLETPSSSPDPSIPSPAASSWFLCFHSSLNVCLDWTQTKTPLKAFLHSLGMKHKL